jgi:NAD-specific glutamate dehydrogenase
LSLPIPGPDNPPDGWTRICWSLPCENAVAIDGERHLDLPHVARPLPNGDEIELAEQLVVGCHLALALQDPDGQRVQFCNWLYCVYFTLFQRSVKQPSY